MKKTTKILIATVLIMLLASCWEEPKEPRPETDPEIESNTVKVDSSNLALSQLIAEAIVVGKSDSDVSGTVRFTEESGSVTMRANLSGLSIGSHAIHIHAMGDCSSHDAKSAGGHWNPTNENHGKWGEGEFHRGDIGNLKPDSEGNAELIMTTDLWCLGCADSTKNIVGKSIMIHAGQDDYTSQPSGNAGKRVGCGAIFMQ